MKRTPQKGKELRTQGGFTIPGFKYPWHSSYYMTPVDVDS